MEKFTSKDTTEEARRILSQECFVLGTVPLPSQLLSNKWADEFILNTLCYFYDVYKGKSDYKQKSKHGIPIEDIAEEFASCIYTLLDRGTPCEEILATTRGEFTVRTVGDRAYISRNKASKGFFAKSKPKTEPQEPVQMNEPSQQLLIACMLNQTKPGSIIAVEGQFYSTFNTERFPNEENKNYTYLYHAQGIKVSVGDSLVVPTGVIQITNILSLAEIDQHRQYKYGITHIPKTIYEAHEEFLVSLKEMGQRMNHAKQQAMAQSYVDTLASSMGMKLDQLANFVIEGKTSDENKSED